LPDAAFFAPDVYFFVTGAGLATPVRLDFAAVVVVVAGCVVLTLDLATDRVIFDFFAAPDLAAGAFLAGVDFLVVGVVFWLHVGRRPSVRGS
jgi:hypothetical protein